jgi:hypothetical protein
MKPQLPQASRSRVSFATGPLVSGEPQREQ